MNNCAAQHVVEILSDRKTVSFATSCLFHEVTHRLQNGCLSACKESRTAEVIVTAVLLQFVHLLVVVTNKRICSLPIGCTSVTVSDNGRGDSMDITCLYRVWCSCSVS